MVNSGFINRLADASLFNFQTSNIVIFLLVYGDDIVITRNSEHYLQKFINILSDRFSLEDLGNMSYFLGIEVYWTPAGLLFNQTRYITDLLQCTNILDAKPVMTPLVENIKLSRTGGTKHSDPKEYCMIIGVLQYLLLTHPYIAYAVNKLSQFMHEPTAGHMAAAKHILRYLCGPSTRGLYFHTKSTIFFHAYSNADWTRDQDDYTSTCVNLVYLSTPLVSWSSQKQKTVGRSSTESEYKVVADTASEIQWIQNVRMDLSYTPTKTLVIYCDNVGATYLCANPFFHSHMKHVAVDYYVIQKILQASLLLVAHVNSRY